MLAFCCFIIYNASEFNNFRSMALNGVACFFIQTLCCSVGLVIYAKYFDCDPYSAGVLCLLLYI